MLVSYSQIRNFLICPARWLLMQKYGLEITGEALDFGKKVHEALAGDEVELEPHVRIKVETLRKKIDGFEVIDHEVPFVVDFGRHQISGVLDAVAIKDGEEVILEFKTGKQFDELQPRIYSFLMNKKVFVVTSDGLTEFTPQEQVGQELNEILERMEKVVARDVAEMKSGRHCEDCPAILHCPLREKVRKENIDAIIEEYFYVEALLKKLKEEIVSRLGDRDLINIGSLVVFKERQRIKRIKKDVTVHQVFEQFGLDALEINTKRLQQLAPELFTEYEKEVVRIEKSKF